VNKAPNDPIYQAMKEVEARIDSNAATKNHKKTPSLKARECRSYQFHAAESQH
jgi:hypothetical protein